MSSAEEIITVLEEIRDLLDDDTDIEKSGGHDPSGWGERFDVPMKQRVSRDRTVEYLRTIEKLPVSRVTHAMVDPFVSGSATTVLGQLFGMGVLGREGEGTKSDCYRYWLTDLGHEVLEEEEEE